MRSEHVTQSCSTLCDPLSVGFSRQEYWSGLSCPPPGDLPNPGIEPGSPALQADSSPSEPPEKPKGKCVVMTSTRVGMPGPQTHLGFLSGSHLWVQGSGCNPQHTVLASKPDQGCRPTSGHTADLPTTHSPGHSAPTAFSLSAFSTLCLDLAIPARQQGPHGDPTSQSPCFQRPAAAQQSSITRWSRDSRTTLTPG